MIQRYEVIVLVHSLKNIYLTSKGYYTAQILLQPDAPNTQSPESLIPPSMLFKQEHSVPRQFVSGKAEITHEAYTSEKVEMKLMDQEVNLYDIVSYKVNVDYGNHQNGITILCHLDKQDPLSKTNTGFDAKIKIKSLRQGMCEYIQVPFEQNHEISLNLCLFSILVGTKVLGEQNTEKPIQNFKGIIKQIRYHSFIAQQKLSKLCSSNKLNQLSEERDKSREYFYPIKSISRQEGQLLLSAVCLANSLFYKRFLEILIYNEVSLEELKASHFNLKKQKYTDFVFIRKQSKEGVENRIMCAKKIRKSSNYQSISRKILPIQIEGEFSATIQCQPVAFYETTQISPRLFSDLKQTQFKSLYVFCHGFQGSPLDLVLLRNNYKCFNPNAYFLLAQSYQEEFNNNLSILEMGWKLSVEISNFMVKQGLTKSDTQLNFVCFSMGGLVARASLIHLKDINFGRYTSISTPHLGCSESRTLVQIGLFMLKRLFKLKCINQLCISDEKNIQQSVIYRLSDEGSLSVFEQVIIVSNNKDTFVPWQSARIETIGGKIKSIEDEMIANILSPQGRLKTVHRLDFDSNEPKNSYKAKEIIQDAIGRTIHVEFLRNDMMIRMMLNTIPLKG